jgi:hypothetical protein
MGNVQTYQCKCTEEIGVVNLGPLLKTGVGETLDRSNDAMIDNDTIQAAKGLDCKFSHSGSGLLEVSAWFLFFGEDSIIPSSQTNLRQ